MSPASPTPIAVAVVQQGGRALIGRRPAGTELAGLWEFPGGKLRPGESPPQAAARECLEETGLAIRITGEYAEVVHQYGHGLLRLHFLAAEPVDPAAAPREPYRWVPLAELDRYEFPAANAAVLRRMLGRQGRSWGRGAFRAE